MSNFIAKTIIKKLIGGNNNSSNPPVRDNQNSNTAGPPRKKRNKWKIPPGLTDKEARILKKVKKRAELLDIGLCDFMTTYLSLMLIKLAMQVDLPRHVIMQMTFNVFVDFMLGLVPVLGDFIDFLYMANIRNAILLEEFLVDRAKNRSVVMEDGSVEVLQPPDKPEKAAPGRDRSGRH
ncbi:9534_t:CDS:2 [Gigaspora rosea]|nr:9534_t:CDS:2 [Gigaspora rosea]